MNDFIYAEEEVEAEGEAEGGRGAPRKIEGVLRRVLALAAVIVCGGLAWWVFISPAMVPATVSVFGFPGLDGPAALREAGIREGATFASVNAAEAQLLLSRHPLVASARVAKSFPDRIAVYLEPRRAVAVGVAKVDGRMRPAYFDRDGVVFMVGGEPGPAALPWLPVVSGLCRGPLALYPGARLPEPILPLFSQIGAVMDEEPGLWRAISEIAVAWNDSGGYDLVLYPVNNFTRVRMGGDLSAEGVRHALLMLDVVRYLGEVAPAEIDARSGIGVLAAGGLP